MQAAGSVQSFAILMKRRIILLKAVPRLDLGGCSLGNLTMNIRRDLFISCRDSGFESGTLHMRALFILISQIVSENLMIFPCFSVFF